MREEYAIFKGHKIRREEYDDGAAIIGGVPVRIHGEARIRTRYLTPYNFIIAPLASQFNEGSVDQPLKLMLNLLLQERIAFEELVQMVERLPLPARFDDAE